MSLEIPGYRIGNHRLQFSQRIALRHDTTAARLIVPASNKSTGFGARLDGECDFVHDSTVPEVLGLARPAKETDGNRWRPPRAAPDMAFAFLLFFWARGAAILKGSPPILKSAIQVFADDHGGTRQSEVR